MSNQTPSPEDTSSGAVCVSRPSGGKVLTTCNALLRKGGTIYIGTRNLEFIDHLMGLKTFSSHSRDIQFLDKENFGATFRSGVWTMQHFHSTSSLEELLKLYFGKVQTMGERHSSQIYAIASDPLDLDADKVLEAITKEFNMEYPHGKLRLKQFAPEPKGHFPEGTLRSRASGGGRVS